MRADLKNLPPPHLVFKASTFQTDDNWHDKDERDEWDPRVVVLFQPNVWVDAETHMHGLKEVLDPIENYLDNFGFGMQGVVFEDNLSSHRTKAVLDFWGDELPNFELPQFVPPNMTDIIQVLTTTLESCTSAPSIWQYGKYCCVDLRRHVQMQDNLKV